MLKIFPSQKHIRPKPKLFPYPILPSSYMLTFSSFNLCFPKVYCVCCSVSSPSIHSKAVANLASTLDKSVTLWLLVSPLLANQWDHITWNICDSADSLLCEAELSLGWYSIFWTSLCGSLWQFLPLDIGVPTVCPLSSHCRSSLHH